MEIEPTGGYGAQLVSELCAAGIACHRIDTVKVKAFARSFGRLGKTDGMDAKALAAYGTEFRRPDVPASNTPLKLCWPVSGVN